MSAPNETVIKLSSAIPAEAVEIITVGGTDIVTNGDWIFGYAKGPRSAFRRAAPIGYAMDTGKPLFSFAILETFTATEA